MCQKKGKSSDLCDVPLVCNNYRIISFFSSDSLLTLSLITLLVAPVISSDENNLVNHDRFKCGNSSTNHIMNAQNKLMEVLKCDVCEFIKSSKMGLIMHKP